MQSYTTYEGDDGKWYVSDADGNSVAGPFDSEDEAEAAAADFPADDIEGIGSGGDDDES